MFRNIMTQYFSCLDAFTKHLIIYEITYLNINKGSQFSRSGQIKTYLLPHVQQL